MSAEKETTENNTITEKEINARKEALLNDAVQKHEETSFGRKMLDKMFINAFKGFVYPQIWEDPEVDLEAMKIDKNSRIMTIASGGCNIMNYMTENPEKIKAVDLNPAHVALGRLKLAALKHLPDYESFFLFFGRANDKRNIENYETYIAPHLDAFSKTYWEGWTPLRGRRINYFTKNLYQFGLLGRMIGFVHILAKIYGKDPSKILTAKNKAEQEEHFNNELAPLFDKKGVTALCNMPVSLYGLGIPPAQYEELKGDREMSEVLKERLKRLAVDFPIEENYFAWQAFGKGYDLENKKAIPRYLTEENYKEIKKLADRVEVHHASMTGFLQSQPVESFDCYVFLDAQDWMNANQLNELWSEVLRTARPGARVIFRTAGEDTPLNKKLKSNLLKPWHYDPSLSEKAVAKDRSSIYGGFHVYTLGGELGAQKAKTSKKKNAA
ncbi:MAG: DUF3419 family protein [Pseudomonadota bacterium]